MINKALALGVIFSLAFNIAFVGIWGYTRVRPRPQRPPGEQVKPRPAPVPAEGIWQQLGLTPVQASQVAEEWRQVGREINGYPGRGEGRAGPPIQPVAGRHARRAGLAGQPRQDG